MYAACLFLIITKYVEKLEASNNCRNNYIFLWIGDQKWLGKMIGIKQEHPVCQRTFYMG